MQNIYTRLTVSATEFKKNPVATLRRANGLPVAVLNHNEPVYYVVPVEVMQRLAEALAGAYGPGVDLTAVLEGEVSPHAPPAQPAGQ